MGRLGRFANWLQNGQPTGLQSLSTTENGAYYLNGATTDAALLAVTRKASATWVMTSEDEWYKAAYYKGGSTNAGYWDYPTSSNTPPGRDMSDASGNNANYYDTSLPHRLGQLHHGRGRVPDVGQPLWHVRSGRQRVGVERGGGIYGGRLLGSWRAWWIVQRRLLKPLGLGDPRLQLPIV